MFLEGGQLLKLALGLFHSQSLHSFVLKNIFLKTALLKFIQDEFEVTSNDLLRVFMLLGFIINTLSII